MDGLIYKEWLYTKRSVRSIAIHVVSPLFIIALNVAMMRRAEWSQPEIEDLTIFFGFYTAISFTTVFRAVERVRAELYDGTGHLYLLTQSTPTRSAMVKFAFESTINVLALVPFLAWLSLSRPGFLSPTDVLHSAVASVALTALTFALSCVVRTNESYRAVTLFLSVTPLLPGLLIFGGQSKVIASLVPTLTAFAGFRSIAADSPVDLTLSLMLACGLVASLAITSWAYPRMFSYALTRPAT